MLNINISAVGRLGADPEAFQAGTTPGASFRLAIRTGKDETTWLKCSVFGKRSAPVLDYFKKGSLVTVAGKGRYTEFEKRDGSKGNSLEINVDDFTLPERPAQDTSNVTPFPDKKSFDNNDQY
tara:strand:+ start:308 stop:676 length:369 start_codon:yes stop_codon:yes gene_type:complete